MEWIIAHWWIWLISVLVCGGWAFLGIVAMALTPLMRGGRGGGDVKVPGVKAAAVVAVVSALLLIGSVAVKLAT